MFEPGKEKVGSSSTIRLTVSQLPPILKFLLNEALDNEALAIVESLEDGGCPGLNAPGRESEEQATPEASQNKLPLDDLKIKPLIWLVRMRHVFGKGEEVAVKEGSTDYYWATVVSLPERYHFSGETFTHQVQRLFFIDACNMNQESFPQQLLRLFDPLGLDRIKVKTHFLQQVNYTDSGWWALYHGLMVVLTGGSHYLRSLQVPTSCFPTEELKQLFFSASKVVESDLLPAKSSKSIFKGLTAFTYRLHHAVIENQKDSVEAEKLEFGLKKYLHLLPEHEKAIEVQAAKEYMREQILERAREKARLKKLKKDHETRQTVINEERKELESKTSSAHATSVSGFSFPQSQGATGAPVVTWGWYGFYPQPGTSGSSSQASDLTPDDDFSPST